LTTDKLLLRISTHALRGCQGFNLVQILKVNTEFAIIGANALHLQED
jgi:hypothetical protein